MKMKTTKNRDRIVKHISGLVVRNCKYHTFVSNIHYVEVSSRIVPF